MFVNLVRQDDDVVLNTQIPDRFQLVPRVDMAGGVVSGA